MYLFVLFSSLIWHLDFGGEALKAEVVICEEEKNRGLMGREQLPDDECMLFVYEEEKTLSFWMKGMKIPISIAFFDRNKKLINFEEMPLPIPDHRLVLYKSKKPAMYAMELPAGWLERHPVRSGERFAIVN